MCDGERPDDPTLNERVAEEIYADVIEAMQSAEELGGPDGLVYVQLMQRISKEAITRAETALRTITDGEVEHDD